MTPNTPLKLNYNSTEAEVCLREVVRNLPGGVEVFMIGGAVRNALIREIHGDILTQRDYDLVVTKGSKQFTPYLETLGYEARPYPSHQDEQVVYSKPLNDEAKNGDSYVNWLVFDIHTMDGTTIEENIKDNVAFTVNGCALSLRDLYTGPWQQRLIQVLPTALQDIKDKKLRLNYDGYKYMATNFYAMLRFMSVGFTPPPEKDIRLLLQELPHVEHARFESNVHKVWKYIGGEDKARALVKDLGVDLDVFDEEAIESALGEKKQREVE
jgi:hypothetical protein